MSVKNNFVDINGNDIEDKLCAEVDSHGLMCPEDKVKLLGIEEGATKTIIDSKLSSTSENPIQNKIINAELKKKLDLFPTDLIPDGADLNDYTEPGSYRCLYATGSSINHLPDDYIETSYSGFILYVFNNTSSLDDYIRVQILIEGNGTINIRSCYPDSDYYSDWEPWTKLGQNDSNDSINLNDKWSIQVNSNGNLNDVWIG